MPKLPSGGMQMPGGFGALNPQINSTMSRISPNIQYMIESITKGNNSQSSSTPQPNSDQSAGGGGFWNPNEGVQRPTIGNTPSTTNPVSPFSMPQTPPISGGVPPPVPSGGNNRRTNFIPPPQSPNYNIK